MTQPIDRRCTFRPPTTRLSPKVRVLAVLAIAGGCLLSAPAARAQVTHPNPIPETLKTTTNALTAAQLAAISTFIDGEIANLRAGKTENEKAGRKALEDAAAVGGGGPASAVYLTAYASALNTKLTQLARSPLQVRLNAAIVVAHVAARANNTMLKDAATLFALDEAEPVALWGVKAGKYLVPYLLDVRQATGLNAAIAKAVERFKSSGAIVEDGYDDFTGDLIQGQTLAQRGPMAIDPLIQLMEVRANLYRAAQNGPAGADPELPAEPWADNRAYSFIALPDLWKSATPAQRQRMCRSGIDLLGQIVPLIDTTPARVPGVDPPELLRREDLIAVINQAGSAFLVIGSLAGEPTNPPGPITVAGRQLTAANVSALTPGTTLSDRLNALEAALKAANLMAAPFAAAPVVPAPPPPRPAVPTSPTTVPARPATPTASGIPH